MNRIKTYISFLNSLRSNPEHCNDHSFHLISKCSINVYNTYNFHFDKTTSNDIRAVCKRCGKTFNTIGNFESTESINNWTQKEKGEGKDWSE